MLQSIINCTQHYSLQADCDKLARFAIMPFSWGRRLMTKTCKAPDPDTRTPAFKLPPNATDAHCHIFGPGDKYPYSPTRTYTPPDAGLDDFKKLQSILGLTRAVLVNASCHGTNNDPILDAIAQSGGAYRGVAISMTTSPKPILKNCMKVGVAAADSTLSGTSAAYQTWISSIV